MKLRITLLSLIILCAGHIYGAASKRTDPSPKAMTKFKELYRYKEIPDSGPTGLPQQIKDAEARLEDLQIKPEDAHTKLTKQESEEIDQAKRILNTLNDLALCRNNYDLDRAKNMLTPGLKIEQWADSLITSEIADAKKNVGLLIDIEIGLQNHYKHKEVPPINPFNLISKRMYYILDYIHALENLQKCREISSKESASAASAVATPSTSAASAAASGTAATATMTATTSASTASE